MQIIILGMHRSGTSCVSRLINMMGAYFAPEGKEMTPQPDNPKGHWERSDVMHLNDEILNSAGGSWDQVSQIDLNKINEFHKENFNKRINSIVLGMDANRPWSLKDPRMCLTLPCWLPSLEVPVFLVVSRNPVQIAQSLAKRNNIPLFVGIALWEYYMASVLNAAKGGVLVFTRYEDVMRDPVKGVRRIYDGLTKAGVEKLRMPGKKEITAFLSPDLFHHTEGSDSFSDYLNNNQLNLIKILENNYIVEDLPHIDVSRSSFEILNNYCLLKKIQEDFSKEHQLRAQAEEENASLEKERSNLVIERTQLEAALSKANQSIGEKERWIEAFSLEKLRHQEVLAKEHQLKKQAEEMNASLESELAKVRDELTQLQAASEASLSIAENKNMIIELESVNKENERHIGELSREMSQDQETILKIQNELIALQTGLSDAKQIILEKENSVSERTQKIEERLNFLVSYEQRKVMKRYRQTAFFKLMIKLLGIIIHPRRSFSYLHDRKIVLNSSLFDEEYYLRHNDDVSLNYADVVEHFCLYGWKEGRNPHPSFDIRYYLSQNPDIANAKVNPLVHFEEYGWKEGRKPSVDFEMENYIPSQKFKNKLSTRCSRGRNRKSRHSHSKMKDQDGDQESKPKPQGFKVNLLSDGEKGRIIQTSEEKPVVSIIVSAYNHWDVTANCLASIVENTDYNKIPYEIILADDCSTDKTTEAAKIFPGLKIVKTECNQGYLFNTNNGASHATGEYIVLLNNDTQVQKGWLAELLETFQLHPTAGIVGSLLCDQNGVTMDSGNLIKRDGTGDCWGRGLDPDHPAFAYVRRCHYVTAACLMIKKNIWDAIGGFDSRYAPSYCEDADLGMEVRKRGYDVLIQPFSRVVHLENVSHGSSAREQIQIRTKILKNKWIEELKRCPDSMGNSFMDKDITPRKQTIVVMEGWVPAWDTNAGARCFLMFIQLKRKMGYNVKLIFHYDYPKQYREYISKYQRLGFEVWHPSTSDISWKEWMFKRRYAIDAVFIHRPNVAEIALEWVKNVLQKPVIYFNHDLHFLRMQRENSVGEQLHSNKGIEIMKRKEVQFIKKADVALSPSTYEVDYCREHFMADNCFFMPLFIYNDTAIVPPDKFCERKTIIFVAGFDHKPNVQGGIWFMENIWMKVKQECADAEIHIVGSNPPAALMGYNKKNGVIVHGYVTDEELEFLYSKSRVAIIPLLSGAGLKGKLLEAMFHGVPVVGTKVAFEGCPDIDKAAKPADSPEKFAMDIITLLTDNDECLRRKRMGYEIILKHFSLTAGERAMHNCIDQALGDCNIPDEWERCKKLEEDKKNILHQNQFNRDQYIKKNPKVFYTGMQPEDFYFFYEKQNIPFTQKHALVISPVSTEFGQGNSVLTKFLTQQIADMGYIIHFVYFPSDNSTFLNNKKEMPWDHVYTIEDRKGVLLKLKYDKNGDPLPDAHKIDDWCGEDLINKIRMLSAKIEFELCLCNYVWLSKTLEFLPDSTIKIIETHDKFSYRDTDKRVLAGKKHSGWFSTIPEEEKKGLDRADYVLAVQEEDAQFFTTMVDAGKVFVSGAALPETYLDMKPLTGRVVLGYIAGVNGFNIDQIKDFYAAWEKRPELVKNTELFIAGSIGKWLNNNNPLPKARINGFVDNVADFYSQCDVIINPDFGGTGIKIKCIEALSFGKPLICSEKSMNGIESDNPFHKAKNLNELLDLIFALSNHPAEIQRQVTVSKNIYRRYVEKNNFSFLLSDWVNEGKQIPPLKS